MIIVKKVLASLAISSTFPLPKHFFSELSILPKIGSKKKNWSAC